MKCYEISLYTIPRIKNKALLIMKLSIILLLATILQVSAKSYAQKITLSEKNAPLEKVLKEIREQSGYDFFYNSKLIKEANPVSINVRNTELEEVLKLALSGQPF